MNNPNVTRQVLGVAEVGTYVGTETDAMGVTRKVVYDDAVVNESLCPPPGMDNAVLAGGVKVVVNSLSDSTPRIIDGNRLRSFKFVVETIVTPMPQGTVRAGVANPGGPGGSPRPNA